MADRLLARGREIAIANQWRPPWAQPTTQALMQPPWGEGYTNTDLPPEPGSDPGMVWMPYEGGKIAHPTIGAPPGEAKVHNAADDRLLAYQRNLAYTNPAMGQQYQTPLGSRDETLFRQWAARNQVPFESSPQADYDMRGFWMGRTTGDPNARTGINQNDQRMHYSDYWKTPYHQSFSAESRFALPTAPRWNERDQLVLPDGTVVFDERARR